MSEERREFLQSNLGAFQRVCGGDYYEFFIPSSIKVLLATLPEDQLDEMALNNSRLFRYRFGFEPGRSIRQQVLEIRRQHEFTDVEIRWLRRSGQLQTRKRAELMPSPWMTASGWWQIAVLNIASAVMALQIVTADNAAWKQGAAMLCILGFWYGGMWLLDGLYLTPFRALKRAGETLSEPARATEV